MMRIVPREALAPGVWDAFVYEHPEGWFFHRETWVDYCLHYRPGAKDLSIALVDGDRVLAVAPLVKEGAHVTMGGHPGSAPLYDWREDWQRIALGDAVRMTAFNGGCQSVAFRSFPGVADYEGRPLLRLGPGGWRTHDWPTHVVRLGQRPEEHLWMGLRKSYRQLTRRTERERIVPVVTCDDWPVPICQRLHRAAAGRVTRSPTTWDLMARWLRGGDAMVALVSALRDPQMPLVSPPSWVGYAYVLRWKGWAYYASGATIEPDVAHALQWAVIRELRARGETDGYEIGWGVRPGDSEKERGIALFKSGFGGEEVMVRAAEQEVTDAIAKGRVDGWAEESTQTPRTRA